MSYLLIIGFYGLVYGSFLNALVWRTHTGERIGSERSKCPKCKTTLKVKDLIPVLSWISLRGKCRYCHEEISVQYPIVEIITSITFILSAYFFVRPEITAEWIALILWLAIVGHFIALSVYDIKWHLLPNKMVGTLLGFVLGYQAVRAISGVPMSDWLFSPLIGAVAAFGFFYLLHILGKGAWMGGGDVKLVFVLGALLGGWSMLIALVLAFNIAALISVVLITTKLRTRKDIVPFGPFLLFGAWLAFLFADGIAKWYLRISGIA